MSRCLILFIDGLPHYELARTGTLRGFDHVCAHQPTFGYSPNLYAEMYAGVQGDDVGFFNEWARDADAEHDPTNRILGRLAPLLDKTRATGFSSTLTHRALSKLAGRHLANIPFRYLRWYAHKSIKVYDTARFTHPSIFGRFDFDVITGEQFRGVGKRDEKVFARGLESIRAGRNVYLSFVDYDNMCHFYGVASKAVRDRLELLDHYVQLLEDTFRDVNPDGSVFVVSDHGMLDVMAAYDLKIEEEFGPADPADYLYFPDSVMCRVWSPHATRIEAIGRWFRSLGVGRVITEDERERWGITSRDFGDLMFVLDPGICFQQNFHGWRLPLAMHGYHPDDYSQWGVMLARGDIREVPHDAVVSTDDIYRILEAHAARTGQGEGA